MTKAQDNSQQLLVCDTVVLLWLAECAAEVGDDLFTVLPLLGAHAHSAGISSVSPMKILSGSRKASTGAEWSWKKVVAQSSLHWKSRPF